jgi:hypothetical protein
MAGARHQLRNAEPPICGRTGAVLYRDCQGAGLDA